MYQKYEISPAGIVPLIKHDPMVIHAMWGTYQKLKFIFPGYSGTVELK